MPHIVRHLHLPLLVIVDQASGGVDTRWRKFQCHRCLAKASIDTIIRTSIHCETQILLQQRSYSGERCHQTRCFSSWSCGQTNTSIPCNAFYRAMLCIRGTSHGPVSVRPSVRLSVCLSGTSRCSTKTAKRRITKTTPHDSTGTLVFWSQRSPRNSTGVTPYGGAKCRWGGSKSATFDK